MAYLIQLDGLRAFAILAVMEWHFVGNTRPPGPLNFPWGAFGVDLFFVLSSFLVTRSLLQIRGRTNDEHVPLVQLLKFYVRRYLRLTPVYYSALVLAALMHVPLVRESFWWHVSYLSNFYLSQEGWKPYVAHLWYLAAQEQFLIFWAPTILFLPRRYLSSVVALTILCGPLSRILMADLDTVTFYVMPFGYLEVLGLGSLLALSANSPRMQRWWTAFSLPFIGGMLAALVIAVHILRLPSSVSLLLENVPSMLFCTWLLAHVLEHEKGWLSRLLQTSPLIHLGRISYPIYIWHIFLIYVVFSLLPPFGFNPPQSLTSRLALLFTFSVVVGTLALYWIQRPVDKIRHSLGL